MQRISFLLISTIMFISVFYSCDNKPKEDINIRVMEKDSILNDSVKIELQPISAEDIEIVKEFLYDKYTLEDVYPYKDTTRIFQWDKIRERLAYLETVQLEKASWAILKNYKNINGEAPLVHQYARNAYKLIADTFGTERYQSVPLYLINDSLVPERYGRDGSLVKLLTSDTLDFVRVKGVSFDGEWNVPKRYVKSISDTVVFKKAIFIDVTNQNITTLEKSNSAWLVRSMNPATTGRHKPPYAHETPTGIFVVEDKRWKMAYLKDGSPDMGGFAPYASRFTNGAYIHGVPTVHPGTDIIEYSPSLGTTPRSHMCVRNASSHAKFVYEWASVNKTIVFVLD